MRHVVFKVRSGKLETWKAWGEHLHQHETMVCDTMSLENCVFERSVLFKCEDNTYVVGSMQFDGVPQKADLSIGINKMHKATLHECLMPIAAFEGEYKLPPDYETVYEFDKRMK